VKGAVQHVRERTGAMAPQVREAFIDLTGIYEAAKEQIYSDD